MYGKEIVAIPQVVCAPTLLAGVDSLLQIGGFGKLKPNTVLIGFKESYQVSTDSDVHQYVTIIKTCFMTEHSVCVFRNQYVPLVYRPNSDIEPNTEIEPEEIGNPFSFFLNNLCW